jgi:hypothetical protein
VFGSAKWRGALVCGALVGLCGCLTPQMAKKVDETLGLTPQPPVFTERREPSTTTVFDSDAALPAQIWYADLAAKIYHERRTNTFIAFDTVHQGWGAIPAEEAYARGFKPEHAKLLAAGPPEEVKKVIDYLTEMEPGWRGS